MSIASLAPTREPDAAAAAGALGAVFSLLERLADVLARPDGAGGAHASKELETVVCGFITHLRARGATRTEITARLTQLVHCASTQYRPVDETAARVAAVVVWCARAERADAAPATPTTPSAHRTVSERADRGRSPRRRSAGAVDR